MTPDETKKKPLETLREFDTVMVSTVAENGSIHARPMALAEVDEAGFVWFATAGESEKTDEVRSDARALVTAQGKSKYVSLSGTATVIHDRDRIRSLWKESWKAWFPKGKDDPSLVLLRLQPEAGEYWDQSGLKGVRYLFEAARALLDGERARPVDDRQHAKVRM